MPIGPGPTAYPPPDETSSAPWYRVSAYAVSPTDYDEHADIPGRSRFMLHVVDAGDGWAIRRGNRCLNFRGQFEFEPPPASRTADFLHRCRFTEQAALLRARHFIDDVTVGGHNFQTYVKQFREEMRQKARIELKDRARHSALFSRWARQGRSA